MAEPFIEESVDIGGADAAMRLETSWDIHDPKATEWVQTYTVRLSKKIGEDTQQIIRDVVKRGIEEGRTIPQIAAEVRERFIGGMGHARSLMIARTETARATSHGRRAAWRQSGIVKARHWARFADSCPWCREMERMFGVDSGNPIALEKPYFPLGGHLDAPDYVPESEQGFDDAARMVGGRMTFKYEAINGPPLHPACRCSEEPVLRELESEET